MLSLRWLVGNTRSQPAVAPLATARRRLRARPRDYNRDPTRRFSRQVQPVVAVHLPERGPNKETGNREAFHNVVAAYRVLCDPVRRAAYDRDTFDTSSPQDERDLRRQLLQTLYNVRRTEPHRPSLPLMVIPDLFGCSIDEAQFTLWYLRGKKFIEMTDDGMAITVAGVDYVESHELGLATGTPPDPALGPGSFMLGAGD